MSAVLCVTMRCVTLLVDGGIPNGLVHARRECSYYAVQTHVPHVVSRGESPMWYESGVDEADMV